MNSSVLVQPGLVCLCTGSNVGLRAEPWPQREAKIGGWLRQRPSPVLGPE